MENQFQEKCRLCGNEILIIKASGAVDKATGDYFIKSAVVCAECGWEDLSKRKQQKL